MVSAFTPFAQCYLLGASCFNITACTVAYIGGCTLKEEHPLQQLDSKKREWAYFEGRPIFERLRCIPG